uniref:Selenocysteine-specific elongation factor n=1 Tax=Lygus hesperus TaxID=30085 RepID=A0A0A9WUH0_LYGHE
MSFINVNVGLLGHVDSGKTSLAKALTTVTSTACFDKHPQSQERGITIDLGFSSFTVPPNDDFRSKGYHEVQVTLVDCPGHASLIKKIIGGAQIIDFMILVVDINKGVQTQTAECLVIAEILKKNILVVLNKADLIPPEKREATVNKVTKKMQNTLKDTIFKSAPMVVISTNPKGAGEAAPEGIDNLVEALSKMITPPVRNTEMPLILAVDHCFSIKGKGTVLTGTIVQGLLAVNDTIEIPHLKISKKVKSMQMFRKDVIQAAAGDRVGVCVTQFESKLLERGVACAPGYLQIAYAVIIDVNRVKYYKSKVSSNSKYHISIGHDTVIAKITLFKTNDDSGRFSLGKQYEFADELPEVEDGLHVFALLEFEQPIPCTSEDLVIVSKLDIDIQKPCCRLGLYGNVNLCIVDKNYLETVLPKLLIFNGKRNKG